MPDLKRIIKSACDFVTENVDWQLFFALLIRTYPISYKHQCKFEKPLCFQLVAYVCSFAYVVFIRMGISVYVCVYTHIFQSVYLCTHECPCLGDCFAELWKIIFQHFYVCILYLLVTNREK